MKWSLSLLIAAAALAGVAFALAAPDEPDPAATFAWQGRAGEPLTAGVFAPVIGRQGIQPGTVAVLDSTVEAAGDRHLVVTGRRQDGSAMLAAAWARDGRLTAVSSFTSVAELGAAPVRPKGVHPLAGWDAKREVVTDRAIIRFEAGGGPRPDRVGWASVVGVVRSDVNRLVTELADGSRRELPINRWRAFGYRAPADAAALALLAYDSDGALVERAELARPTPLCGGAYGRCGAELARYLE